MSGTGKVVCVTGASGYIASWLVKLLLQRGYTVKATVRNLNDPKKILHLKALEGAQERLHLFQADLIEDGSFDSVLDGCEGVFHTASPVLFSTSDPQAELIEPAVKGTLNILRSCNKVTSVRRVVVTSSMASVSFNDKPKGPDVVIDETWFSDPAFCEETKHWYPLSKTLAEEAAWKFSEENGIDLVVMHPGLVLGPLLQPTLNATSEVFLYLIKAKEVSPSYHLVDIRDVAYAHVMAFENPSAAGRYCLVERVLSHSEILQILDKLYPSLNIPITNTIENPTHQVSKKKAESLGINFMPMEGEEEDERRDKVVCVTGASGYVASWLVKLLLQRDYTVKATVRNLNDPKKILHLKALEGAEERLHLLQADLTEDGSFDSVVEGCQGVFHTASPVIFSTTHPQEELIEPAVKGTLNVLRSCSKVTSVRRVVVTSSMASVLFNNKPKGPDVLIDETWFSDPKFCEENKLWYLLSKTLAEKAAWEFAEENGIDLVAMHPGLVVGPLLQPTLNATSEFFLDLIKGKKVTPSHHLVDIRDVAYAHVMAFENPSAAGRYCLVESVLSHSRILQILNNLYPSLNIPITNANRESITSCLKEEGRELGHQFHSYGEKLEGSSPVIFSVSAARPQHHIRPRATSPSHCRSVALSAASRPLPRTHSQSQARHLAAARAPPPTSLSAASPLSTVYHFFLFQLN
ncbi:Tetraketide alpha-pyrone reductase 1 [Sesamum alatum]|uniref:Dihydroflavonol 4-reductase n=1 Tax=Sesamum alatum TaxID=300844 RepID=A0AAE2C9N5_9LAMI|nr:Tetraketide alpha-pyrone reductase 1 [Sesamum alatum]